MTTIALLALLLGAAFAGCTTPDTDGGDGTTPTPGTDDGANGEDGMTGPTPPTPSGANDVYGLTSGSTGGVYYAIANGIQAAVRNATSPGFTISEVPTSGGSVTNVERLRTDDYQLALMQNDVAYYAYTGQDRFAGNAYTGLRAVASLYPEMVQIVTLKESNINGLQDLQGKTVVLGAQGSGAAVNAEQILNASGVQVTREFMDLNTAAERLKDGGVDAVFWTGGVPTGAITSLATTHPVRIVPIDAQTRQKLQEDYPFYAEVQLPANTYNGQDQAVDTVSIMAVLVARDDVPADDVASLLKILFESGRVQQAHAQGQNIKLDNAFQGIVGVPWHEGAKYYYETKGRTVPST